MEEKKEKRVLTIELDENVKKVSITGLGDDETVVMKQELSEEELDLATGGMSTGRPPGLNVGLCNGVSWRACSSNEMNNSNNCGSASCPLQELPDVMCLFKSS